MLSLVKLILTAALVHGALGSSCPTGSPLSVYVEKLQNASVAIVSEIHSIVLQSSSAVLNLTSNQEGPPNVTALYSALTATLNITQTETGLNEFTDAFDVITDAYFKACYGPENERPNASKAQSILSDFLSFLENRSDITRMRQTFGELFCLQNFIHDGSSNDSKKASLSAVLKICANAPNVELLYQCLDIKNLNCIFNLDDPINCTTTELSMKKKKHCLAFVVDTTGSMSTEISHARDAIQHVIQSEENNITLCYVLIPFNDYSYGSPANFTKNLEYTRIYDAKYNSNNSQEYPSFSMTDNSITVQGVNDFLTDVNALRAHGGGDCPEYGMTAILQAIELIDGIDRENVQNKGKHNLIVLTDASAKDESLYQQVIANATAQDKPDVTVHFFYSGNGCGAEGFGHYEDVRNDTGGFSVEQNNAANFEQFTEFIVDSYDSSSGSIISSLKPCQNFQISHFVSRFSCLIETSSSSITITKPDNSNLDITTFANSFGVYKDTNPQPGNWRACVFSGTLQLSLTYSVSLELDIDYLKENKDGAFLPTNHLPYACDTYTFTLSSPQLENISTTHPLYMDVLDNLGNVLQYSQLSECAGFLSGSLTLPHGLVQYQLRGQDIGGTTFTHIVPDSYITFNTPLLQVKLKGTPSVILNPGETSLIRIGISNLKNGPKMLQATVSVFIESTEINATLDESLLTIMPMQEEKELQIMLTASQSLILGQALPWSMRIIDTCFNEPLLVNFTAIVKPSVPFNVMGTSRSTVSFEWSLPTALENITHYTLTLDYNNGTVAVFNVSGDTIQYNLQELSPYQLVYASISAYSDTGATAEIAPIVVLTRQAEPGPVSQLVTQSISESSVYISWSLPQQQNGIILFYEVAVNGLYNETYNSSVYSTMIDGLKPYTRYTAVVSAATSAGKGQQMILEFYSLEGVPSHPPSFICHTILTSTSLTIQWDPPPVQYRRGFIQNYTIQAMHNQSTDTFNTSNTSLNISGLPSFSDIIVSMSVSTSAGQGPFSEPYIIHIVTGVASAPQNFTATATSSNSVSLNWKTPESPNGKILHYQLYFKLDKTAYQVLNVTLDNGSSYQMENLDDGKDYYFIVNAVNYAGIGDNSTEICVSLLVSNVNLVASNTNLVAIILPVLFTCLLLILIVVIFVIILTYQARLRKRRKPVDNINVAPNMGYGLVRASAIQNEDETYERMDDYLYELMVNKPVQQQQENTPVVGGSVDDIAITSCPAYETTYY